MSSNPLHALPGPLLLLAGPGAGKTEQIARRINYLVKKKKVPPGEIAVISFTRAAALNMRERISDKRRKALFIPDAQQPDIVCTMHNLGYRIVKAHAGAAGYAEAPSHVVEEGLRPVLLGDAAQLLGMARSKGKDAAHCRQIGDCRPELESARCRVCGKYREILRRCGAIDYDDQVLLACKILRESPEAIERWRRCARHLLVDEYQDINAAQFELVRLLAEGQREGLFAVGDDDQSVYGFRGGSPAFIRRFREDFGEGARVEQLAASYRCPPHFLEGALRIVEASDPGRIPKAPPEHRSREGAKITIHSVPGEVAEALQVLAIVQAALPDQDVLVLLPSRRFLPAIEEALRRSGFPFASQPAPLGEGFPLLLQLGICLHEPSRSLDLRACLEAFLEHPSSGVPSRLAKKPLKRQAREAAYQEIAGLWGSVLGGGAANLWQALARVKEGEGIDAAARQVFARLAELEAHEEGAAGFLEAFGKRLAPWRTASELLLEISEWVCSEVADRQAAAGAKVRVMTMEGAKGLQADVVCIVGMEKGVIPRHGEGTDEAEQARLLFVSMTRAVRALHLIHARQRGDAASLPRDPGRKGMPATARSRFLDLIPLEHVEKVFHNA